MKNHLRVAIVVLLVATMACKVTGKSKPTEVTNSGEFNILSVEVDPPSGTGNFTLKVTYNTYYDYYDRANTSPGTIQCTYVAPDMKTGAVGDIVAYFLYEDYGRWVTKTEELAFSVTQPDGVTQTGSYLAGCGIYNFTTWTRSPITDPFIVVPVEIFPTEPPIAPPQEPPKPPTITLTGGTITYDGASEQQTPHPGQNDLFASNFHKWCNPSLTIAPDGAISGDCYSAEDPGDLGLHGTWFGGATIEGKVTGKAVPGGSFTFREELNEKYVGNEAWSIRTVIIEGTGTFVSATKATGTATLSAECNAWWDGASMCGLYSAYYSFTGTINWEFNDTGVTSEADGVSPARQPISITIPLRWV